MKNTKNILYPIVFIGCLSLLIESCKKKVEDPEIQYGQVPDKDGNTYKTVEIGNQTWFAENLKTKLYNDGTVIPEVSDSSLWTKQNTGARSVYGNTLNVDTINDYGRLYNYFAVKSGKLCPSGWHVPSASDWNKLEEYLKANGYNYKGSMGGKTVAKSLASKTGWSSPYSGGVLMISPAAIGEDPSINNKTGFSAMPGGYRNEYSVFLLAGEEGIWWSSTEVDSLHCITRHLSFYDSSLILDTAKTIEGNSVRCLKD